MTALAARTQRQFALHTANFIPLPAAANAVIFVGALVATNSSGLAVPAADTSGFTVQGICRRTAIDNTGGSAGSLGSSPSALDAVRYVEVDAHGEWEFAVSAGTPKPGTAAFVVDDNTVSASATTNSIVAGKFTRPASANSWFVDVERR
jgi:hypothetical protein